MTMRMTPGRVAALAIGAPFVLALIGWTSYDFVALTGTASEQIATSVPVRDGGVNADIAGIDLVLRQAAVNGAELTGVAHYSLFRPVLTQTRTATGTGISYTCRGLTGDCGLAGTLEVPPHTGVTLSSAGSDVTVPGFTGDLTVLSEGGDVDTGSVTGTVRIQTDGGDIGASSLSGSLSLRTGGGDLAVNAVTSDSLFQAQTDGGDVSLPALSDPDAAISSSGGDVTVALVQAPRDLQITSDGGDITVVLPPGGAGYDIQATTAGGDLTVDRSITENGDAEHVLVLDSGGGDITVTEAS